VKRQGNAMPRFEYKLVPAPEKATKHKGLKGAANFSATLEDILNELGADGWHYLRADTLPHEERSGLTSKTTTYRNILVFQRPLPEDLPAAQPVATPEAAPAPPADRVGVAPPPPEPAAQTDGDPGEPSLANLFAKPDDSPDTDPQHSR
jgi:hypothetical protein